MLAIAVITQCAVAPHAAATESVTYEIYSDTVALADVQYAGQGGRTSLTAVPLPWRIDVANEAAAAQLRADWRRVRAPGAWVTVRILQDGRVLCQSTLDVGNATCYGNTPHVS